MQCFICGNEIDNPDDSCSVPNSYIELYFRDRARRGRFGNWAERVHLDCVKDPHDLDGHYFRVWSSKMLLRDNKARKALEEKVAGELAIIHRALLALPDEMISAYVAEAYDTESD